MKQVALMQDPTPPTIAKRHLPLFPASATFHSFPTLHALNLTPSVGQFRHCQNSNNGVERGKKKVFHMLQPTDSSDDHLGRCTEQN